MPNWASGQVQASGRPSDIEGFCRLFLFQEMTDEPKECFSRSLIPLAWEDFKEKHLVGQNKAKFGVDFAWSAASCLINGYSRDAPEQSRTLSDACKRFKVNVVIDTEEPGIGFEEHIECDKNGDLTEDCHEMPSYQCLTCENVQFIPSSYELCREPCTECESIGKWRVKKNELLY